MTRQIRAGKGLECSCCGQPFRTWDGYEDQDRDNGYGVCLRCQGIEQEHAQKQLDKAVACLYEGLSPENQAKFERMSKDEQEALALTALEEGMITFSIAPRK